MLRKRTILVFIALFLLAFLAVRFFSEHWIMVFLSLFFLFVGSVFIWVYLDFSFLLSEKKWRKLPKVSVVIPNYNGARTIGNCLKAVTAFDYPKELLEIIVSDDGSTDASVEIAKKFSGVKVLVHKKNKGKAAVINDGLKTAKGEFAACIDSDTYPEPDCLRKMIALFDTERVCAVTGLICVHKPRNLLMRIQEIEYLIGFGFYQSVLSFINAAFVTPGPMCVYRRQALLDIGGYDEENITEDMEIALRLQYNGYQIRACHQARIYTEAPATWKGWLRQRLRWYRGKIFNTKKYREMVFNPRFGDLGVFSLPFTFILELSSIFTLFIIAVLLLQNAMLSLQALQAWHSISTAPPLYFPTLLVHSSAFFTYFILISVFLFAVAASHSIAREKISVKKAVPITSIIVFYSLAVAIVWLVSLFKEINKSSYRW